MKRKIIVSVYILILVFTCVDSETSSAAYTLNLSTVPSQLRSYVEQAPESFEKNMNSLLKQGYSESEAFAEMERRLVLNLQKKLAKEEEAGFEQEISGLPSDAKFRAHHHPEEYKEAKKRFVEGVSTKDDLWLLGLKKLSDGSYCPSKKTRSEHLADEISYVNSVILLDQRVEEIKNMRMWLRRHEPLLEIPEENFGFLNAQFTRAKLFELVNIERSKVEKYYTYYRSKADYLASLKTAIAQQERAIVKLERQVARLDENVESLLGYSHSHY